MKEVIGIYCDFSGNDWDENTVRKGGIGGSETWACEIASEFQSMGYHVILFCQTFNWHFADDGVEYVPYVMYKRRIQYQKFDYFIFSRDVSMLDHDLICDKVYIMAHDMTIKNACRRDELKLDRVRKMAVLSPWHRKNMKAVYGIPDDKLFMTFNGVDMSYYSKFGEGLITRDTKQNAMVWSSCLDRGFDLFVTYMLPYIKKEVPDFKLYVCTYLDTNGPLLWTDDAIEYVGKLGKQELADLQMSCNVWGYPAIGKTSDGKAFFETFCITAVENVLAGNATVVPDIGALPETLGWKGDIITTKSYSHDVYGGIDKEEDVKRLCLDIAMRMVMYIKASDWESMPYIRDRYNICKQYTWYSAAQTWENEFRKK